MHKHLDSIHQQHPLPPSCSPTMENPTKKQRTKHKNLFYYQQTDEELLKGSKGAREFLDLRNAKKRENDFLEKKAQCEEYKAQYEEYKAQYEKYKAQCEEYINEYNATLKDMGLILFLVDGGSCYAHLDIRGDPTRLKGGDNLALIFRKPKYGEMFDELFGGPYDGQILLPSDPPPEDPDYDLPYLSGQMAYERWKSLSDGEKDKYRNLILESIKSGEEDGWEYNTVEALRIFIKGTVGISKDYHILNEDKTKKILIENLKASTPLLDHFLPGNIYHIVKNK